MRPNPRILQVNDYAWKGGCEVLMHLTAARLAERGLPVEIFTADAIEGFRRNPLGYVDSRHARTALRERLDAFEPDVVHLHNIYHELSPGILGTLGRWRRDRSCRVLMTAHDGHVICPNAGLRYFRGERPAMADPARLGSLPYLLTRRWDHRGRAYAWLRTLQHLWNYRVCRRRRVIDLFLCPSRFMADLLHDAGLPTAVLPNPAPAPARMADKPPGTLRLVFAGRVEPEKGLAEFLTALPAGLPAELLVIGDGSALPACRHVVARRRIDDVVSFAGRLPHEATLEHLARAHVAVLPSRCYENAPFVLLEALSRQTNLLVSDLGGMREIVEASGVGHRFDPEHPETIRDALGRIADEHEAGRLNDFDASDFLRERSEDAYLESLVAQYRGAAT